MKKILLVNCPSIIKQAFCLFNYELIDIHDFDQTLGYSLKLDGFEKNTNTGNNFNESMMIFFELSDEELDGILKILKLNQIKVDYKAIVTEHNVNWTIGYLRQELYKEKLAIEKMKSSI